MPIYHEQWKQAGINRLRPYRLHSKRQHVLERLAQKSLIKIETVKFEFSDYKVLIPLIKDL